MSYVIIIIKRSVSLLVKEGRKLLVPVLSTIGKKMRMEQTSLKLSDI